MKKILHILPLLSLLAAPACEIPFALDNVSDPAFYVQYLPGAGMNQDIMIGYAEPAFEKPGGVRYPFSSDNLKVLVNGKAAALSEKRNPDAWNRRILSVSTDSPLKPGDLVEVSISGEGLPSASSSTVIPQLPEVGSLSLEPVTRDSSEAIQITLKMARKVEDGEYMGLKAKKRTTYIVAKVPVIDIPDFPFDPSNPAIPLDVDGSDIPSIPGVTVDTTVVETYFTPGQIASTADLNSLDLDAYTSVSFENGFISAGLFSRQPLMLLSSRQFTDGDTYVFYANSFDSFDFGSIVFEPSEPSDTEAPEDTDEDGSSEDPEEPQQPEYNYIPLGTTDEYCIEIYRLSDEFYNYAKAQYLVAFNMLSNFGVTPPNFTYTNVQGGLGVVAGLSGVVTSWQKAPEREN